MMLQATPAVAITVSSTTFEGNVYNLMTDGSGNEWLSLLATDGQTYGFVESQIDNAIGDYADYHFATQSEVMALFTDYGAVSFDTAASEANFAPASALQSDFGSTGSISIGEPLTWGYTSTILVQGSNSFPNFHLSPFVRVQTSTGEARFRTALAVDVISDPNTHLRGSWLIHNTAIVGDLDGNGFVGIADLNRVLGNWNQTVTPGDLLQGDAFDDPLNPGFIGIADLNVVLGNWNAGTPLPPPGAAVPEPGTLATLVVCGLAFVRRRRTRTG